MRGSWSKRTVADLTMDNQALKDLVGKKGLRYGSCCERAPSE